MDYGQKGVIGLQHACIFFDEVGRPVSLNGGNGRNGGFTG